MSEDKSKSEATVAETGATPTTPPAAETTPKRPREIGGPKGLEPTRYGDWEVGGRCTDF